MSVINAKTLRRNLARVLERARRGERFTVLYRSRPLCEIVPLGAPPTELPDLEHDPVYRAKAVGESKDGKGAADHDEVLYGWRRR
jgi:antitoxin (DNA-binding transcriptional repressor) of toxin-antitoxin stability system